MLERQPQGMKHWAQSMEAQMAGQRQRLRARRPQHIADNSGAVWTPSGPAEGTLSLAYFQRPLRVQVPEYLVLEANGAAAPTMVQALVTAYLLMASGAPRAGEWVAFRDLPDGAFYHQAFTGYTGDLLSRALGDDLEAFERGARAARGSRLDGLGDAAYELRALPRLWLAVTYWLGDVADDFPPQAQVLFDRAASQYMIIDGLAIIGSQLVRLILSQAGAG